MNPQVISTTLNRMVKYKHLGKLLSKKVDDYIYKGIVNKESEDLREVQIKRYQFLSAMLHCVMKNVNKGYVSPEIIRKIIDVLVENNLIRNDQSYELAIEKYEEKYGELPPTFIVFSPTQKCNLKCVV